jgi:hypothetical protein
MIETPSESLSYSPDPCAADGREPERREGHYLPHDPRRRGTGFHAAMSRRLLYSGYEESRLNGDPSN